MSKELKSEIVDAIQNLAIEFQKKHKRAATSVHLTPEIRKKIESLKFDQIGAVSNEILDKGIIEALPTIFGLKVVSWESENVKVE